MLRRLRVLLRRLSWAIARYRALRAFLGFSLLVIVFFVFTLIVKSVVSGVGRQPQIPILSDSLGDELSFLAHADDGAPYIQERRSPVASFVCPVSVSDIDFVDLRKSLRTVSYQTMTDWEVLVLVCQDAHFEPYRYPDLLPIRDRLRVIRFASTPSDFAALFPESAGVCSEAVLRHLGSEQAQGEYVVQMTAGDLLAPTFLEKCVLALDWAVTNEEPVVFCHSHVALQPPASDTTTAALSGGSERSRVRVLRAGLASGDTAVHSALVATPLVMGHDVLETVFYQPHLHGCLMHHAMLLAAAQHPSFTVVTLPEALAVSRLLSDCMSKETQTAVRALVARDFPDATGRVFVRARPPSLLVDGLLNFRYPLFTMRHYGRGSPTSAPPMQSERVLLVFDSAALQDSELDAMLLLLHVRAMANALRNGNAATGADSRGFEKEVQLVLLDTSPFCSARGVTHQSLHDAPAACSLRSARVGDALSSLGSLYYLSHLGRHTAYPGLLSHFLDVHRPTRVVLLASEIGYQFLPFLASKFPAVPFLDVVDSAYPARIATLSVRCAAFLSHTVVFSENVRAQLVAGGRAAEAVTAVRPLYLLSGESPGTSSSDDDETIQDDVIATTPVASATLSFWVDRSIGLSAEYCRRLLRLLRIRLGALTTEPPNFVVVSPFATDRVESEGIRGWPASLNATSAREALSVFERSRVCIVVSDARFDFAADAGSPMCRVVFISDRPADTASLTAAWSRNRFAHRLTGEPGHDADALVELLQRMLPSYIWSGASRDFQSGGGASVAVSRTVQSVLLAAVGSLSRGEKLSRAVYEEVAIRAVEFLSATHAE